MNITRSCRHQGLLHLFDVYEMDWNGRSLDIALLKSHPVPSDFEDSPTDTSMMDVLHKVNAGLRAGKMTVPGWQLYLAVNDLHISGP